MAARRGQAASEALRAFAAGRDRNRLARRVEQLNRRIGSTEQVFPTAGSSPAWAHDDRFLVHGRGRRWLAERNLVDDVVALGALWQAPRKWLRWGSCVGGAYPGPSDSPLVGEEQGRDNGPDRVSG